MVESNLNKLNKKLTFSSSTMYNGNNSGSCFNWKSTNAKAREPNILCRICNTNIQMSLFVDHELCHQLDYPVNTNEESNESHLQRDNIETQVIRRPVNVMVQSANGRENDLRNHLLHLSTGLRNRNSI